MSENTLVGYSIYTATIAGVGDLLTHNGGLADPANPIATEMRKLSSKRKKVTADHEAMANLEFRGGLYIRNGEIIIPPRLLESALVEGARASKEGQIALAGVFVEQDIEFNFAGPRSVADRLKDPECRLTVGVKVQRARIMRTRPLFSDWSITFRVSALASSVTEDMLERWITSAGLAKGLGDWRPRYGRFALQNLEKIA